MPFSPAAPSAIISVRHVSYYDYPEHRVLDDVSFELPPASITALVGPNGAGKTTLLRAMAALEEPMGGEIFINGLNIWQAPREAHRLMGYLPDHFGLYQELSAHRCLLHAARTRGLSQDEAEQAAQRAARQVNLADKLKERAGTLSRGQRQRLALAQAIVHRPQVLLLDEPASGLDPQARADLSRLLKSLAAEGMTLLISSHILAELESYCMAILVLEQGRLLSHQHLENRAATAANRVFRLHLSSRQDMSAFPAWLRTRQIEFAATEEAAVWHLAVPPDEAAQARLLRQLAADWEVLEFTPHTRNLQEVYLETVATQKEPGQ
ncbi:MAG: ABC transporter ATP-binding protein [Desulfobulbaceae bacterium]|jgi:ABC-2 type transport system ATP-binding protein|nr:ABC transporter ATP-binding protein [Desulfobulbaceae bacterium]